MTERELLKIFGSNIKLYRVRLKWSQAELAENINISINFLSDIETGKKWASPITMVKFADIFNVKPYELLKPIDLIPENYNSFINKFAEEIHSAVEQIHTKYLKKSKIR
ncbi:MAG: helix-turn-helix domain-containing protein [Treponema sp.]|nr:helix-turn-helix domain-containing protein [Treponema sp.]MCL2271436.1 helix-turn-helix domain-containing protein [Treponema sp.]